MPSLPPDCERMSVLIPTTTAVGVDERPAAVARVDRRVGLHVDHRVFRLELPRHGAHDAHRHRVVEAERAAERHDDLARGAAVRVAERQRRAGCVPSTFSTARSVSRSTATICAPTTAVRRLQDRARPASPLAAGSSHLHAGALHHVRVGDDVPVRVEHHARAARPLGRDEARRASSSDASRSPS